MNSKLLGRSQEGELGGGFGLPFFCSAKCAQAELVEALPPSPFDRLRVSAVGVVRLAQAGGNKRLQIRFWTRAIMRDDFGRTDRTHDEAVGQTAAFGLPGQEPGGK